MHIVSRQPSDAAPPRVAPLSVLPVFLDLAGKPAVVIGGSDAAAWKAGLLAAAGAAVTVHAPAEEIGPEMARLLDGSEGAAIGHDPAPWASEAGEKPAILVADAASDEEAATIAAAAARAGIPCNVIDRPAHCTFQFGSIVNRSPVVVGISTSGAAPILGQAVRRRIETLLPPALAEWGELASHVRDRVTSLLAVGVQRRAFWEAFVDRAFGPAPGPTAVAELLDTVDGVAASAGAGRVTFVGAGPGDAELLTLKAVRALQAADVILFDDLVSEEVLEVARRGARRILVGKRAGRRSCKQSEINEMMINLVRAGRHVVRQKSGDPMVFGRGGEEIERLEREGIPFAVVPGITAGAALAAETGVSLAHRDIARQVRFVTAHSRKGGLPDDIGLAGLADPASTTIVYMGGRTAAELSARLTEAGVDPASPVAIGVALGRKGQRLAASSLQMLSADVQRLAGDDPVVIGIGRVFGSMPCRLARIADGAATAAEVSASRMAG